MTRENKLALIVGFSLLLVVAILLADHLSPAQQEEMARLEPTSSEGPLVQLPSGLGDQYRRQFGESSIAQGPAADPPGSREITLFDRPREAMQPTLDGRSNAEANQGAPEEPADLDLRSGQAPGFERHLGPDGGEVEPIIMSHSPTPPLPGASTDERAGKPYVVQDGDTLYGLSRRFYGDGSLYEAIMKRNADVVPATGRLRTGITLLIPEKEVLTGRSSQPPVREQAPAATGSAPAKAPAVKTIQHTIREDDRLWDLAKKYLGKGGRWQEIVALNRDIIRNPDVLPIGKTIRIPAR